LDAVRENEARVFEEHDLAALGFVDPFTVDGVVESKTEWF
jgi:hypothetical protein